MNSLLKEVCLYNFDISVEVRYVISLLRHALEHAIGASRYPFEQDVWVNKEVNLVGL